MSKIILEGYIIVPDGDMQAVQDEIPNHIQLTRAEPGCLVFEISRHNEIANRFSVYEEFVDRRSFELHQKRVGESVWGAVSVDVERYYQITED